MKKQRRWRRNNSCQNWMKNNNNNHQLSNGKMFNKQVLRQKSMEKYKRRTIIFFSFRSSYKCFLVNCITFITERHITILSLRHFARVSHEKDVGEKHWMSNEQILHLEHTEFNSYFIRCWYWCECVYVYVCVCWFFFVCMHELFERNPGKSRDEKQKLKNRSKRNGTMSLYMCMCIPMEKATIFSQQI